MTLEILDPTHEAGAPAFRPATRLPSLAGKTVGIISNGKCRSRSPPLPSLTFGSTT